MGLGVYGYSYLTCKLYYSFASIFQCYFPADESAEECRYVIQLHLLFNKKQMTELFF